MGLLDLFKKKREPERSITTVNDYIAAINSFTYQGNTYGLSGVQQTIGHEPAERIGNDLVAYAQAAYMANGPVFACMAVRQLIFSAVRFQWQQLLDGSPSRMFGTDELAKLERPWFGGTTQDLLSRTIQYADLAGNSYAIEDVPFSRMDGDRQPDVIVLRPDWMQIVLQPRMFDAGNGKMGQVGWRRLGYVYTEGGTQSGNEPVPFLLNDVSHFAPHPDPLASWRGMSWLTPVIRELSNDKLMSRHQQRFFENGAPQPLDARVLTPRGWSTMGAMVIGSEVIGSDGKPHRVTGVFPKGEQDIYQVKFADGSVVECTEDHLWSVQSNYDRQRGVLRTLPLREIVAAGLRYRSGPSKWAVPFADPIEYADPGPLPVDPYLLGLLLGDGCFRSNGKGSGGVSLAADARDGHWLEKTLPGHVPDGVSLSRRERGGCTEFYFRGRGGPRPNSLTGAIRSLELWDLLGPDKFIPEMYFRASVSQRIAVLQGLLDSDGSVEARQPNSVTFSNRSHALAIGVRELARSLGGTATTVEVPAKKQWLTRVQRLPAWITPFALPRKVATYNPPAARGVRHRFIVDVKLVGRKPAQCISVDTPDCLYVTDDFVLTHNTVNMVVSFDKDIKIDDLVKFKGIFNAEHAGVDNAYKALFLGGGADATVVGSNFEQMTFTELVGATETRIASAAGVPPIIAGFSKGLESATYSNYGQARRRLADGTMHPLWQNAAGSFEPLLKRPPNGNRVRLWYDATDVPFLREDEKDAAEIQGRRAQTIRQLVDAGYSPESVVAAVEANDFRLLVHSGLYSVQLQPPGTGQPPITVRGEQAVAALLARGWTPVIPAPEPRLAIAAGGNPE